MSGPFRVALRKLKRRSIPEAVLCGAQRFVKLLPRGLYNCERVAFFLVEFLV